eukprot:TRINITY_DN9267_c0_g1_i2.p1 TRINITY_DN9267_c0_g1~~TRINITY_DN9267_c0_g1_i2.p1  ORF type:complete len:807 (+),score=247.18 TRINITY_DN9267_c0_g1_i2:486-2906(+)
MADPVTSDPQGREQLKSEELKNNLATLKGVVKNGDVSAVPQQLRQAVQGAKQYVNLVKKNSQQPNPSPLMLKKLEAVEDIEKTLPGLVQRGKDALLLNNPSKVNELLGSVRRVQRAVDRGDQPQDEKRMRDIWNDIVNHVGKARKASQELNPVVAKDGLAKITDALRDLRNTADRRAGQLPDRALIEVPMTELEKAFQKFGEKIREGYNGNKNSDAEIEKQVLPTLNDTWRRLCDLVGVNKIAPLQDIESLINDVQASADTCDPVRLATAAKELVNQINVLPRHVELISDPTQRDEAKRAVDQLASRMRDFITKARDAVRNPEDTWLVDETQHAADKMKLPLTQIKYLMDPVPYDRPVESAGGQTKKAMADLREAIKTGNSENIRNALQDLRDAMAKYNQQAEEATEKLKDRDPKKKDLVMDELCKFKNNMRDVQALKNKPTEIEKIKEVIDGVEDSVNDVLRAQQGTERDDLIKALAFNENLLASLGSIQDDQLELDDLLETAGTLSSLLRGLVGETKKVARNLGVTDQCLIGMSKAALELDQLIQRLENGPELSTGGSRGIGGAGAATGGGTSTGAGTRASDVGGGAGTAGDAGSGGSSALGAGTGSGSTGGGGTSAGTGGGADEVCMEQLPPIPLGVTAIPDHKFQAIDLRDAVSLEDVVDAVAYDIHQQAKLTSTEGDLVAMELSNLAAAARTGERQALLMAAKAAATHIQVLCQKLNEVGLAIPCRNQRERLEQDRLLKCSQGLKDYATQLKILAAVKASTIEDSRDTDDTLASLTMNLGLLLKQGLRAIHVTEATILKHK